MSFHKPAIENDSATLSDSEKYSVFQNKRPGFTLVELTVVIAMIALLMAVLLPAIQTARDAARKADCSVRLKRIGAALQQYHQTHSVFPYASTCSYPENERFTNVKHVWTEFLLPYLDETPVYEHINFSESVDTKANRELLEGIQFQAYACPSNPFAKTLKMSNNAFFHGWGEDQYGRNGGPMQGLNYPLCAGSIIPDTVPPDCVAGGNSFCASEPAINGGPFRWFYPQKVKSPGMYNRGVTSIRLKDVTDGTSQTIAAGERNAEECALGGTLSWNAPIFFTGQKINSPTRTKNPLIYARNCGSSSHHEGGANMLFVDGAVRFMNNQTDLQTYCYLGDKDDGHKVQPPEE